MKEHQEPFVSIIMPVMHNDQYLKLALESVKKQLYTNYELLIIGCSDVIESIRISNPINDKSVYIDSQEITDSGGRRNIGIQKAKGKYILFLDSDDEYYDSKSVKVLVEKIEECKLKAVGGSCVIEQGRDKIYRSDLINSKEEIINYMDYQNESGFYRFIYNREHIITKKIFFMSLLRFQDCVFMVEYLNSINSFGLIKNFVYIYRKEHKKLLWTYQMYLDHMKGVIFLKEIAKKNNYELLNKKMNNNIMTTYKKRKPDKMTLIYNLKFYFYKIKYFLMIQLENIFNY